MTQQSNTLFRDQTEARNRSTACAAHELCAKRHH